MKKNDNRENIELKKWIRSIKNSKSQRDLRKWWKENQEKNTVSEMKKFNSAIEKAMNTKVDVDLTEFLRFAITVQRKNGSFYYTIFDGTTKYSNGKFALTKHKLDMSDSMSNLYWLKGFLINILKSAFEMNFEIKVSRNKVKDQVYSLTGKDLTIENIIPSSDYNDKGVYDKKK